MNRLILIGNGFDLAHGLPTKYEDFVNWYWNQRAVELFNTDEKVSSDGLCELRIVSDEYDSWRVVYNMRLKDVHGIEIYRYLREQKAQFVFEENSFFRSICERVEQNQWVDIENEYYRCLKTIILERNIKPQDVTLFVDNLNHKLRILQEKLIKYLGSISCNEDLTFNKKIEKQIYGFIKRNDVAVKAKTEYDEYLHAIMYGKGDVLYDLLETNNVNNTWRYGILEANKYLQAGNIEDANDRFPPEEYETIAFPESIMLLSFNYTDTAERYLKGHKQALLKYIHGKVDNPKTIIFGYGDELDEAYKQIQNMNENRYLQNIKSIRYLESDNYRRVIQFIESGSFQVYIMGHSCGNSDRTLLNTIFEHDNCVSIKPYFYKYSDNNSEERDNYIDIVQNISRNFTDMKKMRDRVVNKIYCEPLGQ